MDRGKLEDAKLLTLQVQPTEMSPQNAGNAPKLEKAPKQIFPESLKKETELSYHLGFHPGTPCQMCDLLNRKTIKVVFRSHSECHCLLLHSLESDLPNSDANSILFVSQLIVSPPA